MSTYNRLGLKTLGSQLDMHKSLPLNIAEKDVMVG